MTARSEIIEWFRPEERLPDDDTTVLVIHGGDDEVFLGFHDAGRWKDADGFLMDNVVFWAHLPEGPAQ